MNGVGLSVFGDTNDILNVEVCRYWIRVLVKLNALVGVSGMK